MNMDEDELEIVMRQVEILQQKQMMVKIIDGLSGLKAKYAEVRDGAVSKEGG